MKYSFPDSSSADFHPQTQNNAKPCRHHQSEAQLKSLSTHRDRRLCSSESFSVRSR
ncbi:hypothetical protein [Piscirickettsia litoralis]|uniref:hypothetical protein n=1 Tax=Piscirickettsia litoralis TaxID=1891921 RepID=UPI0013017090|nr:hypothetical protein [Piscirickettsia litoralis]